MFSQGKTLKKRCAISVQEAAKLAHESKHLFPTVYRSYSLHLKAPVSTPVSVTIKNSLRSKMEDQRLNNLILLAYEKDLTDTISLEDVLGKKCEGCRLDKLKIIISVKIKLSR